MDLDDATARLRRLQQQHYDETTSWQPSNNGHAQNGHQEESIDPQLHEKPLSFDSKLAKSSFDSAIQLSTTEPRALPDHDVTDETIDDAYVAFIFYCNPAIPVDTDASELRTGFRASPKSDGKQFSIFKLFELIRKLELKELKTWVQLALELGVEPPALDKGQSAQKVQQYAVRLKRWMHAMHVDAFFEFLLHKPHPYWTQIPTGSGTPSEFGRDGVPPEEDLALRALVPEMRPKRGRRPGDGTTVSGSKRQRLTDENDAESDKVDERSQDDGRDRSQSARHSPALSEDFARARGSFGGDMTPATAQPVPSSFDHFHGLQRMNSSSAMAYPQSAITPSTNNPFAAYPDEPRSAITPSRPRKRHGPAVSSAWPANNPSAGKLRGRPPSNRIISDGPFSTFPANPNAKVGPVINLRDPTPTATPIVENSGPRHSAFPFPDPATLNKLSKPSRLHLQVPERVGGPVRLATPPPFFAGPDERHIKPVGVEGLINHASSLPSVNVDSQGYETGSADSSFGLRSYPAMRVGNSPSAGNGVSTYDTNPTFSIQSNTETLPQISSQPVTQQVSGASHQAPRPEDEDDNINEIQYICAQQVRNAEWFDASGLPIPPGGFDESSRIVKQAIRDISEETESKEIFLLSLSALAGSPLLVKTMKIHRLEDNGKTTSYDMKWTMKFGAIEGSFRKSFVVVNLTPDEVERLRGVRQETDEGDNTADGWRKKYIEAQQKLFDKNQSLSKLRNMILSSMAQIP